MLFSSGTFIFLFLPVSLIGYQLLSRFGRTALLSWLALASLAFYAFWNPVYLLLLAASILLNFLFSHAIGSQNSTEAARSRWLKSSIIANLLLLIWFKYLFPTLGFLDRHRIIHHDFGTILLPLGISFFTFTQIAYLIDLREGIAKLQGLLPYTVFVTFFPHLIAGPIIHPRHIMPQLDADRLGSLRANDVALGLSWFIMGLAKKVLIADHFALRANALYTNPAHFGPLDTWLDVISYTLQLYFDFSGYSDMAVGLARMFSIDFPFNFDSPFKASSIIEFWQRWHMTLSRYIAEYLYTPIQRSVNRRRLKAGLKIARKAQSTPMGFLQMVLYPTMIAMFIAGIWHGAGLQFLVFGVLNGIYLVVNHAWRIWTPKGSPLHQKLPVAGAILLNFVCVLITHVFFRASDVHQAMYVLQSMVGFHGLSSQPLSSFAGGAAYTLTGLFIVWALPNTQEILGQITHDSVRLPSLLPRLNWRPTAIWSIGLMILFCASILMLDTTKSFLYFQF
jgi:alginate O-acetyltransferase complex protein AlgI